MTEDVGIECILGYFCVCLVTTAIHYLAYRLDRKSGEIDTSYFFTFRLKEFLYEKNVRILDQWGLTALHHLKFFLSPDYWSAYSIKSKLKDPDSIKQFITNSNHLNFLFSLLLFMIVFLLHPSFILFNFNIVIIIRTVSRAIEVMISFYDDIFQEEK